MSSQLMPSVTETARFLECEGMHGVTVGMILGTGFGKFAENLEHRVSIPYDRIPYFPVSTVVDHAGNLICGYVSGKRVLAMQGRVHCYEGYTPSQITFPVRVMKQLGVEILVVTNAAGGLNPFLAVGDLMLIEDHLNMLGVSLRVEHETFNLMSTTYYMRQLQDIALSTARQHRISLRCGILAAMLGPSFETPAEITMLRQLGADAVTMSTIPEVVMANHLGMRVMGVSCISNQCVGDVQKPVRHEDVMAAVHTAADRFSTLMTHVLKEMV